MKTFCFIRTNGATFKNPSSFRGMGVCQDIEGAKSKEEFIRVWKEIHPRKGFVPEQKVWFHRFKKIEEDDFRNE